MNGHYTVTVGIVSDTCAWARSIDIKPWIDDYQEAVRQLSKQIEDDAFKGASEVQQ